MACKAESILATFFRRRLTASLLALFAVCLLPGAAAAARPGAAFLRLGVGGRAAGMGEAYVAAADDITALYWNTAGLAQLDRKQFIFMHNDWFEGIKYEYIGYAQPVQKWGVFAGSLAYVDKGDMQRTTYSNQFGTGLGTYNADDYALTLAWSRRQSPQLAYGGAVKVIRQEVDNCGATSYAIDLGVMYHDAYPGLTLGAALANLGTSARFDARKEQLPLMLRAGAAYRIPQFPLLLAADAVFLRSSKTTYRAGLEYTLNDYLALRCGYNSENDAGSGFGGGFGLTIDDLQVNYAYVPFGDLGGTHRIDSVFKFGQPLPAPPHAAPVAAAAPRPAPAVSTPPPTVTAPVPATRPAPPAAPAPVPVTRPAPPVSPPPPAVIPPATRPAARPALPPLTAPAAAPAPAMPAPAAWTPEPGTTAESILREGDELLDAGASAEAAQRYMEVLRREPRSYHAYYKLGHAAGRLGQYAAAREAFRYAVMLRPQAEEALVNLGVMDFRLNDFAAAEANWRKTLEINPDNYPARHNLERLQLRHMEQ